ncbi:MAG: DUF4926 domain-containing protein [Candidatus Obscuribacter sp.]|nr:DUF4926 domain-containing protein [Candidatus Obscuribacter sp.]
MENTVVEWDDELVPLTAGCSGTILAVSQEQNSYLVEFTDDEGESLAMVPIAERLLELVWQASTRELTRRQDDTAHAAQAAQQSCFVAMRSMVLTAA